MAMKKKRGKILFPEFTHALNVIAKLFRVSVWECQQKKAFLNECYRRKSGCFKYEDVLKSFSNVCLSFKLQKIQTIF